MNESMNQRWLRWFLTAIVVLLAVIAIELSALVNPVGSPTFAQVPDSGLQRKQLLDAQMKTNTTLEQIHSTLEKIDRALRESTIKVKVVGTDKEVKDRTIETPSAAKRTPGPATKQ